jgi:hypothetical protein
MIEKKIYINEDNMATFICPKCEYLKIMDISKFKELNTAVRIKCKCKCGHAYSVLLERRRYFRKKTNLPGVFVLNEAEYPITIKDISRTGMKIMSSIKNGFSIGDRISVEFNLDDRDRSFIKRDVIIKKIDGSYIGAEFPEPEFYGKLAPYLFQ